TVPGRARAMLSEAIDGVLSRHPELHSLVLHEAGGRALTPGADAPALVSLIAERERGERRLVFGPLQTTRDGARVVPVALRTSAGQWLVAQLDTGEFQRMIAGLDT